MQKNADSLEQKSVLNSILINSAIGLRLADKNKSFEDCIEEAKENIFNGNALKKLIQLREITNKN